MYSIFGLLEALLDGWPADANALDCWSSVREVMKSLPSSWRPVYALLPLEFALLPLWEVLNEKLPPVGACASSEALPGVFCACLRV